MESAAAAADTASLMVDKTELLRLLMYASVSAVVCEFIAWLLVYRRADYEKLSTTFNRASKRLEKKKEECLAQPQAVVAKGSKPKVDKKLAMLERDYDIANRDLMIIKVCLCTCDSCLHQSPLSPLTAQHSKP